MEILLLASGIFGDIFCISSVNGSVIVIAVVSLSLTVVLSLAVLCYAQVCGLHLLPLSQPGIILVGSPY